MDTTNRLAALQVSVQVQIGNLTVPVNAVTLSHEINELPQVELSLQLDNQDAAQSQTARIGSVDINLAKFGKLEALFQEHILNDFSLDTDLQVLVRDGDGHEVLFKGYLGKPTFQLQAGQLLMGLTGLHAMAVLQAFNGQIYQTQASYGVPMFADFFSDSASATALKNTTIRQLVSSFTDHTLFAQFLALTAQLKDLARQPIKNDSVAQRLRVITEGILKQFVNQPGFNTEEPLDLSSHALNQAVLPRVQAFLNGSAASSIIPNISDPVFEDTALHVGLFRAITGQANFLAAITSLLPDFLFQLNAQWGSTPDSPGLWLEHLFTNAPTDGRLIQTAIQDVGFSMSSLLEIPLLQVIVQGLGSEYYSYMGQLSPYQQAMAPAATPVPAGATAEDFNSNTGLKSLARYPATVSRNAVGRYVVVQAPYWINPDSFIVQNITMADPPYRDPFANAIAGQQAMINRLQAQEGLRQDMLNYLAEFVFKDYYLQKTYSSVSIPLNLQVQVGRTYSVRSISGKELFTGFLHRVEHKVLVSDSGGLANTRLDFTHIQASGARITALEEAALSSLIAVDSTRSLSSTSSVIPNYAVD